MEYNMLKAVIEIRFSNIVDTQTRLNDLNLIANDLKRLYGNSTYDFANKLFIMDNPISACKCMLAPDKFIIDSNSKQTISNFLKIIEDTLKTFREKFFFDEINRIGFRTFYGKDCKTLEQANEIIMRCFNIEQTNFKKFSKELTNLRVGFNTNEDEYTVNFNFSAATNKETQVTNGVVSFERETFCVLADMDTYIEGNCKYSKIFEYITSFKNITEKNVEICESIL